MKKSVYILLYFLGIATALLAALWQNSPGYMDADYYYAVGTQIAGGKGFSEPFLWNYLDDPVGIPHPSHLYWMPLASILASWGMIIAGSTQFWAARLPFILISGFIPVLSASLATEFLQDKRHAWIGGMLGVVPGLYVIYLSLPETFVLFLVLGGVFWLLLFKHEWDDLSSPRARWAVLGMGLVAGLMHLSRADGLIWAAGGGLWLIIHHVKASKQVKLRVAMLNIGIFGFGYLLIMGLWYVRNLQLSGSIMPPGNQLALWITHYNQTFSYPASLISRENWLAAGMRDHLKAWRMAFSMNIQNLIVVQWGVILTPLIIAGLWSKRRHSAVKMAAFLWLLTFIVMTLVFPFAGARGGYLHSGSAFQVLLWAAVPAGLEKFVDWGKRVRGWQPNKAIPTFGTLLILVCAIMTGWFYLQKVIGAGSENPRWGSDQERYRQVIMDLNPVHSSKDTLFMVNNPPGFFNITGYSSIVIPGGDSAQMLAAAARYGADYLILEAGQENLSYLFESPQDLERMRYLREISGFKIFCFDCQGWEP